MARNRRCRVRVTRADAPRSVATGRPAGTRRVPGGPIRGRPIDPTVPDDPHGPMAIQPAAASREARRHDVTGGNTP